MTRKRVGQGLLEAFSEPCETCHGRGVIVHLDPVDDRKHSHLEPLVRAEATASAPWSRAGRRGVGGCLGCSGRGPQAKAEAEAAGPCGAKDVAEPVEAVVAGRGPRLTDATQGELAGTPG